MKRFLSLICFILLIGYCANPVEAVCNYQNLCPQYSGNMGVQTANFMANSTGMTFLAEQVANNIAETELKRLTGQTVFVDVKALSANELAQGKFKSLDAKGYNLNIKGFYLSFLEVKTLCDYNYIDITSNPIKNKENLVLDVTAEMTATDIKNTIDIGGYSNDLRKIKIPAIGIASFYPYTRTINIENGKLYFTINATPTGPYPPMDISVSADINVQNGQILRSRVNFINLYTGFDLTGFSELMSSLHNLNFAFEIMPGKKAELQIQNITIGQDRIILNGTVFIPKS